MLQIHQPLSVAASQPFGVLFGPFSTRPMACANLSFSKAPAPAIEIVLQGEIIGPSVELLRQFLREAYKLPGQKWTLHMSDVEVISFRALHHLVGFARRLRTRGTALRVVAMHPAILASVYDLKLNRAFNWHEESSAPTVVDALKNATSYWDQNERQPIALSVAA